MNNRDQWNGWIEFHGVTEQQLGDFEKSLQQHVRFVREAGVELKVPESQLAIHDKSKWTEDEFPRYAANFHGKTSPVNAQRVADNMALAWLHHIHHNPHHWQFWMFPDGYSPKSSSLEKGIIFMPENYLREMVADWMGASMAYTGSWDMLDWLNMNLKNVKLHSKSWLVLVKILEEIGYFVYIDTLANEYEVTKERRVVGKVKAIGYSS